MDIIEEFKQLVEIDSASGRERAIADVLKKKLTDLGFGVLEDQAGSTFGGNTGNLIAIKEGTREGSVLFCSHMDRVANGCGIHPREKDGKLVSDGSTILAADDVSGLCAILDGVRRALASEKPHPRLEIAFTVGEEARSAHVGRPCPGSAPVSEPLLLCHRQDHCRHHRPICPSPLPDRRK